MSKVRLPADPYIHIVVSADFVKNLGAGYFELRIPGKELSRETNMLFDSLFPHTREEVSRALDKEAILNCIASDAETNEAYANFAKEHPPTQF